MEFALFGTLRTLPRPHLQELCSGFAAPREGIRGERTPTGVRVIDSGGEEWLREAEAPAGTHSLKGGRSGAARARARVEPVGGSRPGTRRRARSVGPSFAGAETQAGTGARAQQTALGGLAWPALPEALPSAPASSAAAAARASRLVSCPADGPASSP